MAADAQASTQGGHAVQHRKTHARTTAVPAKNDQAIQLYGRWVIDVRNPDGSVAEHRAFENTITNLGNNLLIGLLAGQLVSATPSIQATSAQGQPPCSGGCFISPGSSISSVNDLFTLTLSGQTTATQSGVIDQVRSVFVGCALSSGAVTPTSPVTAANPAECQSPTAGDGYGLQSYEFTQAQISSVNVSAGQSVQVSVSFSFASQ
jgi:hypothetical protein